MLFFFCQQFFYFLKDKGIQRIPKIKSAIISFMSKTFVDHLIHNMKLADIVTKVTPWSIEGFGEKQMNVRYVGLKIKDEWKNIISEKNNLLVKFVFDKNNAYIEFYLANKPPFFKITSQRFSENDKWETLLGEIKRRLRRDKAEYLSHNDAIGNLYKTLVSQLRD